jgi:hypothetical protein
MSLSRTHFGLCRLLITVKADPEYREECRPVQYWKLRFRLLDEIKQVKLLPSPLDGSGADLSFGITCESSQYDRYDVNLRSCNPLLESIPRSPVVELFSVTTCRTFPDTARSMPDDLSPRWYSSLLL